MGAQKRIIEVDDATAKRLESRAAEVGVSVSDLIAGMVVAHDNVQLSEAEIAELDRQFEAVESGGAVRHDRVVQWLETWGRADFRPWNG